MSYQRIMIAMDGSDSSNLALMLRNGLFTGAAMIEISKNNYAK